MCRRIALTLSLHHTPSSQLPFVLQMASAGFTIAPLSSKYQAAGISQECLVTMVLKLDLGGWLSEQSRMGWLLRPFMHGIHSSYLEPMLMSVIALRDKVGPLMCL